MANALTVFRLILIPVFLCLLLSRTPAADKGVVIVFGIAALTDLADGYIARRFHLESDFGRLLDPFADRALIVTAIFGLYLRGVIPLWAMVLLFLRDGIMVLGYWLATELEKPLVSVNTLGKCTNFYLMLTIVFLLFFLGYVHSVVLVWAFYLGVVLYMASGLVYIIQEASLLSRGDKETA